ncbi:MAG: hypothetical protein IPO19_05280 [Rhodoferax sp.]|nr:hypothetical protein [Rhodoferax sp.]
MAQPTARVLALGSAPAWVRAPVRVLVPASVLGQARASEPAPVSVSGQVLVSAQVLGWVPAAALARVEVAAAVLAASAAVVGLWVRVPARRGLA